MISGNSEERDIQQYSEQIKELVLQGVPMSKLYLNRLEAFKLSMCNNFEEIATKRGLQIKKNNSKEISAIAPKLTLKLWEEQEYDDKLILNFITSEGRYWGFAFYIEPNDTNFKMLDEYLGWHIDNKGELASHRAKGETVDYYKNEVKRITDIIETKKSIASRIDALRFTIELW